MDGTVQGLVAVGCGIILFLMGYWKGRHTGISQELDSLISMRILKVTDDGNIVRGDRLDLE